MRKVTSLECCIETGIYLILLNFAGVTHVGGDMFESVPNGDAIFMKVNSRFYRNYLSIFSV